MPYFGYSIMLFCIYTALNHNNITNLRVLLFPILGMIYPRAGLWYPYYCDNQLYFLLCWNGVFWFITAMCMSTLLYLFFLSKYKPGGKNRYNGFAWTFLVWFCLSCFLKDIPILLSWSIDTSFCLGIFMVSGMLWASNEGIEFLKQQKRSWA